MIAKIIFIDAKERIVSYVNFNRTLHQTYPLLGCESIEIFYFDALHQLICADKNACDSGLFTHGFVFDGLKIWGSGIIAPQIRKDGSYYELGLTPKSVVLLVNGWLTKGAQDHTAEPHGDKRFSSDLTFPV